MAEEWMIENFGPKFEIMYELNPRINEYLTEGCMRCPLGGTPECKVHNWPTELETLRNIVLECGLTEERKWGVPCYTVDGANVLIVSAFKEYASLSFFKGVLLKDEKKLLISPGEHSQAVRYFKFTDAQQILDIESTIREYIKEAIEVEKAGLKVDFSTRKELEYPKELNEIFDEDPAFRSAFESLTPGRQRGYILYFTQAKQSATRTSRIRKYIPKIFEGKGWSEY